MTQTDTIIAQIGTIETAQKTTPKQYGIEFFHIYTDEQINGTHKAALEYLREAQKAWNFPYTTIVLIDDYNPVKHVLTIEDVLQHLEAEGATPDYWAKEADLVGNAQLLLQELTSPKLKRSYQKYIDQNNKYPCSLLTASWYLTRLGHLPSEKVIRSTSSNEYTPCSRLVNILPEDYKQVENKALKLIRNSSYKDSLNNIQDLFYPLASGREVSLW